MSEKRIVLITGGNTGFGYQVVRALYKSTIAYQIIIGSRSQQKAQDAVNSLQTEVPQSASSSDTIQIDIEHDSSIQAAFDAVNSKYGKVDVLINNAGKIKVYRIEILAFRLCIY